MVCGLDSLGFMPGSGIVVSYGRSIISYLRSFLTDFHYGSTSLYYHQQYIKVPLFLYSCLDLSFVFLMVDIPINIFLIYIPLMSKDGELFLRC